MTRFKYFAGVAAACVFLALGARPAAAQTGAIVKVQLQVFAPGVDPATGAPVQTTTAALPSGACNLAAQAAPGAQVVIDPRRVEFDDPSNVGKVCRVDLSTFFGGLPVAVGQYHGALVLVDDVDRSGPAGVSVDSFLRLPPVPSPGHVRVLGGGV